MNKSAIIKPYTSEVLREIKSLNFLYFVSVTSKHPADNNREMVMLVPFKDIFEAKDFIKERYEVFELFDENKEEYYIGLVSIHDFQTKEGIDYRIGLSSNYYKNENSYPILGLN